MKNRDLIDEAYKIATHDFKNKEFDFNVLCSKLIKKLDTTQDEFDKIVGSFYCDLLQDTRFIFIGNNKWSLKENLKIDEYRKYLHSLYDYSTDVEEEGYDADIIKAKIKEEQETEMNDVEDNDEDLENKSNDYSHTYVNDEYEEDAKYDLEEDNNIDTEDDTEIADEDVEDDIENDVEEIKVEKVTKTKKK